MSTSNLPLNQDPASKYYIHPSDANSSQLVSVKFNGDGFNNWKRAMKLALSAKNKLSFVDGIASVNLKQMQLSCKPRRDAMIL